MNKEEKIFAPLCVHLFETRKKKKCEEEMIAVGCTQYEQKRKKK